MGDTEGNAGRRPGGWLMRVALPAIALAAAVPVCAQTVSENFDRIRGERTIAYTADGSTDLTRPVLTFNASLVGNASSASISLAFVSAGDEPGALAPRFAACHKLDWIVDGRPLPAAPASHRGRVVDGEMIELIDQDVTTSWVATVGGARTVRYRVCRDEYDLTPGDLHAFAVIAAKLKNVAPSPSGSRTGASVPAPVQQVDYQGMNWRPKHQDLSFPSRD